MVESVLQHVIYLLGKEMKRIYRGRLLCDIPFLGKDAALLGDQLLMSHIQGSKCPRR